MDNKEIIIFAELTPKFEIAPVVFELVSEVKKMAEKLPNSTVSAIVINKNTDYSNINKQLAKAGFNKVYLIKNDIYEKYSTELYTNVVAELLKEKKPSVMLFGATRTGRDLAPRVASRLSFGLTADCTKLDITEDGNLEATRPTFGGNLMATILSKSPTQMATVRPNVFKPCIMSENEFIEVEEKFYPTTHSINKVEQLSSLLFDVINEKKLTEAQIVVAGGKGMKNQEGFSFIKEFASLINAKVGASRGAVEMGLADEQIQIGQTGKTVMPKIYIACGISGAVQHIVGMSMAKKIIAINSDANAPIFKYADYGIVGNVFEILPILIKNLKGE